MQVTVKLFGPEAQAAGVRQVTVNVPAPATCADVRRALEQQCPPLATRMSNCRLALNHDFAPDNVTVTAADEVALIGPVSGG